MKFSFYSQQIFLNFCPSVNHLRNNFVCQILYPRFTRFNWVLMCWSQNVSRFTQSDFWKYINFDEKSPLLAKKIVTDRYNESGEKKWSKMLTGNLGSWKCKFWPNILSPSRAPKFRHSGLGPRNRQTVTKNQDWERTRLESLKLFTYEYYYT